jgi:hypothetical protein
MDEYLDSFGDGYDEAPYDPPMAPELPLKKGPSLMKKIACVIVGIGVGTILYTVHPTVGSARVGQVTDHAKPVPMPKIVGAKTYEDGSYVIKIKLPARPEYGLKGTVVTKRGCRADGICR